MRVQISVTKQPVNWEHVVYASRARSELRGWLSIAFAMFLFSCGLLSYSAWAGYEDHKKIYNVSAAPRLP